MESIDISFSHILRDCTQLLIAFILPILTAWEREADARSAGLRTFPIVSMAACSFTMLAVSMFPDPSAQARLIQGIITGIGFIGGGAILKSDNKATGTSTAAAIWSTGAVGIAVGLWRLEIAIALSVMTFLTFLVLARVKKEVERNN